MGWDSFLPYVRYVVGDGMWVSFWGDRWCGGIPLKEKFPELYSCTVDKEVLVSSMLETNLNGDGSSWNVHFL